MYTFAFGSLSQIQVLQVLTALTMRLPKTCLPVCSHPSAQQVTNVGPLLVSNGGMSMTTTDNTVSICIKFCCM